MNAIVLILSSLNLIVAGIRNFLQPWERPRVAIRVIGARGVGGGDVQATTGVTQDICMVCMTWQLQVPTSRIALVELVDCAGVIAWSPKNDRKVTWMMCLTSR